MEADQPLNGFIEDHGCTYYYVDGAMAKGFTKIGEDYYFFNASSGKMYKDATLWVGDNAYGVIAGRHYFGADGKMEADQPLNGFVEDHGYTYYYIDGVMAKGFTKIGEDYYFFNASSGKMYKDVNLWVGDNAYGVSTGMHYFDAEGKMN